MRILFLNQYFPPDPAPTGMLLQELAGALAEDGHTAVFVGARQEYRGGQKKGGRMLRELKALATMLWDGLRAPRAAVVISATSPPCVLIVAVLVAMRHRARSIHWIMDLYPEIAVTLGELTDGWAARAIARLMGWGYRRCEQVVALDSDMAERLQRYGVTAKIIRPWVFQSLLENSEVAESGLVPTVSCEHRTEPWTWIYSGNLGRAHEWETLLQTQAILEARDAGIRLLFQGSGPSRPAAEARAKELGLKDCEWRPYVPEDDLRASLLGCDCYAVTQLPSTRGLLWPSKLGLLRTLPRPLLWVGPLDGAIARDLRKLPHAAVFAPGQGSDIAAWLMELKNRQARLPSIQTSDADAERTATLATFRALVASV